MTIYSRPDGTVDVEALDTNRKVSLKGPTRYTPLELCDKSVYEMAQHYYTADEIAKTFKVTIETLLALHRDAFEAGKRDAFQKPRMLMKRAFEEFEDLPPGAFTDPKTPIHNLIKLMEMHARKYEGYGKDEIKLSLDKPSAGDIRFEPFTKEEDAA